MLRCCCAPGVVPSRCEPPPPSAAADDDHRLGGRRPLTFSRLARPRRSRRDLAGGRIHVRVAARCGGGRPVHAGLGLRALPAVAPRHGWQRPRRRRRRVRDAARVDRVRRCECAAAGGLCVARQRARADGSVAGRCRQHRTDDPLPGGPAARSRDGPGAGARDRALPARVEGALGERPDAGEALGGGALFVGAHPVRHRRAAAHGDCRPAGAGHGREPALIGR